MILDIGKKYFDYETITEPLVAVPLSVFKKKFASSLKPLSDKGLISAYKLALKEKKEGKLVNAREFMKTL